jgi:hypothetical protein
MVVAAGRSMTARINTTVHNVDTTFDGKEGIAHRAEIVETSLLGASERNCELVLSGLPEDIRREAMNADRWMSECLGFTDRGPSPRPQWRAMRPRSG